MLRKNIKLMGLVTALAFAMILTACNSSSGNDGDELELGGKDIEIPYAGAGSTARSLVLAKALEDVGYHVTSTPVGATGPMFAMTAENKDTLNASGWFPSTDKKYLDKYGDDIKVYKESNFIDKASLSLTVPEYMDDVDSIEDLKDNKELGKSVHWTITGIDPRTGMMKNTKKGLDNNDLDKWDLHEGSESAMISELTKKYKKKEPIIITGWKPHWIFNEMDLKMLKDPDKIYGKDEHINLVFNKDFKDEHPAAYKIATRMADDWTKDDEDKLMKRIFVKDKNGKKTADDFIDDHSNRVDDWEEGVDGK